VFIDFSKALDMLNCNNLFRKERSIIRLECTLTRLTGNILRKNYVQIDDNVSISQDIRQTNRVLQDDLISPFLFIITTMDVIQVMQEEYRLTKLYMYIEDMTVVSEHRQDVQNVSNNINQWANNFVISKGKTGMMIFRKAGKRLDTDHTDTVEKRISSSFMVKGSSKQPASSRKLTVFLGYLHTVCTSAYCYRILYLQKNYVSLQCSYEFGKSIIYNQKHEKWED
jgi:hypothetical protein